MSDKGIYPNKKPKLPRNLDKINGSDSKINIPNNTPAANANPNMPYTRSTKSSLTEAIVIFTPLTHSFNYTSRCY